MDMIAAIDLDGNGLEQPPKLGIVEIFERTREVAWERDPSERRRAGRCSLRWRVPCRRRSPILPFGSSHRSKVAHSCHWRKGAPSTTFLLKAHRVEGPNPVGPRRKARRAQEEQNSRARLLQPDPAVLSGNQTGSPIAIPRDGTNSFRYRCQISS